MGSARVLVIGNGGREHALVWKLASERAVAEVVCAPGNAGINRLARCIPVDPADPHAVEAIARREEIDFTIVGPELPLSRGVADVFAAEGHLLFGPTQRAAMLESSKVFAKDFMHRCSVPTARYKACDSPAQALAVLKSGEFKFPVVIKADGLAAGKGVVICDDLADAETQVHVMMVDQRFGHAGARLVIEELLVGREASFFVLSDGTRALPLGSAEDHKRAFDADRGPNTGGMGAYAPSSLFDAATQARVMKEIVFPVLEGMRSEGSEFRGFLFVGLMLTTDGPKVIEFNVRFGDPEAQVVLPMIADDLLGLLMSAATGELGATTVSLSRQPRVGVVLASGGYPDTYDTGQVIHGLEAAEALPDVNVFHSGTATRGDDIVTAGGRVLTVVASGADYQTAIDRAYEGVAQISFDRMHYRKDIGAKALA
ncbi:MAG TPA: phosphoribosylamine--glycine ligase [Vicinamibacterales bacterium]|nr:phosphoribosylamine--glycine ligase [Vicinamibacterales bacterium]